MKRNWNTVEIILLHVEIGDICTFFSNEQYKLSGITQDDFVGHVEILADAGILKNCTVKRDVRGNFAFCDMQRAFISMEGHDLLDAIRNKNVWERVKQKAAQAGTAISWEFIKAAIPVIMKELVN